MYKTTSTSNLHQRRNREAKNISVACSRSRTKYRFLEISLVLLAEQVEVKGNRTCSCDLDDSFTTVDNPLDSNFNSQFDSNQNLLSGYSC